MFSPNIVLIAMRTTEVGVETFSLILNIMSLNRRLCENGFRLPEQKREDGEGADVHSAPRHRTEYPPEEPDKQQDYRLPHSEVEDLVESFPLMLPVQEEQSEGEAEPDTDKAELLLRRSQSHQQRHTKCRAAPCQPQSSTEP